MTKKRIIWISTIAAIVLIVLAMLLKGGSKETKIYTDVVSQRNITEIVSVNGKIQPESEVKISADVSGEIVEMLVQEGDSVVKGQLLLRINPELYETTLSQLSANLDNARASLASNEAQRSRVSAALISAEINFKRQKQLYEQKVISEQEYDNARIQFEMAKADLTAADKNILAAKYSVQSVAARLEEGRRNLGRTSIYAPASGIITQLSSEKGERVVGTAQMAGTEIMRISNLNRMEVEINVNENDIVRLKTGDSADIKVDAYPGRIFKGVVTAIANSAKFNTAQLISDQVTSFVVKVFILPQSYADLGIGSKQPFRPGMTASVDVKTNTRSNVLSVPISAVTTKKPQNFAKNKKGTESKSPIEETEEETGTWVFLYNNGVLKSVKIETGIQDINYFEVTKGLNKGDEVVAGPGMAISKLLKDGEKVKKVSKEQVFDK